MEGQVCHLEKLIKELSSKEKPIKLIFVDWASAFQHKNAKSPIREKVDHPVLQSPFWNKKDSLQSVWKKALEVSREGKLEKYSNTTFSDVLFALNKDNKIVGLFEFSKLGTEKKQDLANAKIYEELKAIISKTIKEPASKSSKDSNPDTNKQNTDQIAQPKNPPDKK